jgi:hypothetical protein
MKFDLHCHSTASDGDLTPVALFDMANDSGLDLFAITDHDTIAGYLQLSDFLIEQGSPSDMRLISGVEFSCLWKKIGVHIVGLGFDASHPVMTQAIARQAMAREQRGLEIAEKLFKKGITGAYEGALRYCDQQPWRIGRPHFARYLLDAGHVATRQQAFDRWLGAGKCGDVKNAWPSIEEAVGWITGSGGVAVIAHPVKYKMTNMKLRSLLADFASCGGQAIEVAGGGQTAELTRYLARLCLDFDLYASGGSDFHGAAMPWYKLGEVSPIPDTCKPVWDLL